MRDARGVCVLICGLCVSAAMTGAGEAQTFDAGVKGGIAVSSLPLAGEVFDQIVDQPSIESSSKTGVIAGAYVSFPFSGPLSFQPEALFVMKGVKLTEAAGAGVLGVRLYYIDVPLLVRFQMPINPQTPAYLLAGPTFGGKIGSSATLEGPGQTVDVDVDPAIKSLDLGLTFGGGIERGRYLVEARFAKGLTDIGAASFPHLHAIRNRTLSLMVGMKFR
jgi:hypothetical protein